MKVYVFNIEKLNQENLFQKAYELIDCFRKEKVDRCKNRGDKNRSLGAGMLLAYGVADTLKTPWSELKGKLDVEYGEHGKPYFKTWKGIAFNLSHSGSYAVCALSQSETPYGCSQKNEVGIDIQKVRACSLKVAKRVFSSQEYARLETVCKEDERQGNLLFSRLWAERESRGKLLGTGVFLPEEANEMIVTKNYMIEDYWISVASAGEEVSEEICVLTIEELLGALAR